jgi:hypothetical protein
VTISERSLSKVCVYGAMPDRLVKDESNHDSHNVKEVEVQPIVKQRYSAIHQQNTTQPALLPLPRQSIQAK